MRRLRLLGMVEKFASAYSGRAELHLISKATSIVEFDVYKCIKLENRKKRDILKDIRATR